LKWASEWFEESIDSLNGGFEERLGGFRLVYRLELSCNLHCFRFRIVSIDILNKMERILGWTAILWDAEILGHIDI
jgi:hypothetical protein